MPFIKLQNETTVAELAERAFHLRGRKDAGKLATQATAALLQSNPHLKKLSSLPRGTPVFVPSIAPVPAPAPPGGQAGAAAATAVLDVAAVHAIVAQCKDALAQALAARRSELARAAPDEVIEKLKAAGRKDAAVKKQLAELEKSTAVSLKNVADLETTNLAAFAALEKQLAKHG